MLKRYALILAVACIWLSASCSSKEQADTLDRLPCVESLTIEKKDPLHIRVVTSDGTGGVFIRRPNKPKALSSSADVFAGQTFVVHQGQTGYDFTLEGMQNGLLKFSTTIVENCGVPQTRIQLVKPYTADYAVQ